MFCKETDSTSVQAYHAIHEGKGEIRVWHFPFLVGSGGDVEGLRPSTSPSL
jgi:hypothetical protein